MNVINQKYSSTPGTKALSIKLRELRRSSNYSQTIALRRSAHYPQVSGPGKSSQFPLLQGSRRSLHYAQSTVSKKSNMQSLASRRSSHHPDSMESRRGSDVSKSFHQLLKQESYHIGSNIRTRRNVLTNEKSNDATALPLAGALLIASCLGGPVMFGVGLKLGMFATIGGGIMGYTTCTGKMLEEHGLVHILYQKVLSCNAKMFNVRELFNLCTFSTKKCPKI